MRTFYIASSVHNIPQTSKLADCLIEQGLNWACAHDWTRYTDKDAPLGSPQGGLLVVADIMSAVAADLFVMLRTNTTSHGAHAELGARLASNKEAHLILQDAEDHLFYYHPLVVRYRAIEDFLHRFRFGKLKEQRDLIPRLPPE
jgi:hypothetical protein